MYDPVSPAREPLWKKKRFLVPAGLVTIFLAFAAGIAASGVEPAKERTSSQVFVPITPAPDTAPPTTTVTPSQAPSSPPVTTAPSTPAPAATTPAPVVTMPPPPPPPPAVVPPAPVEQTFAMPNLVGSVLQDAQDEMQRTVGAFFFSSSHDADGQGRAQLLDANWKVCDQNIAPGTQITFSSVVDFGAVKLSESCP